MHDGTASAFVGSHNVTGFALRGLNGEAGVLLEGLGSDPTFAEVQQHINQAYLQAAAYDSSMKEAYAWWTREFFDGLRAEANDSPRDSEPRRTVVVVAAQPDGLVPKPDDVIYFEIAEALSEIRSIIPPIFTAEQRRLHRQFGTAPEFIIDFDGAAPRSDGSRSL